MQNYLYYGDNLEVLRRHVASESVDLVYLDPPFNSNQDYNVLFADHDETRSAAQIKAFEDTWRWDQATAMAYQDFVESGPDRVIRVVEAFREFLGASDMLAYLTMMAPRLVQLHRVLKPTGSLFLHCDPTASHYLKILLDAIFGASNFRNEISWVRSQPKSHTTINLPNCRDIILRYSRTDTSIFNKIFTDYDDKYVDRFYRYEDGGGRYQLDNLTNPNSNRPNLTYEFLGVTRVWRWTKERMKKAYEDGRIIQSKDGAVPRYKRYLHEMRGQPITDNWDDIGHLHGSDAERLGYPTQKPVALLRRIIEMGTDQGHTVLDPFCGCGTTIDAAQELKRKWIGIDITHLAINLIKWRLKDRYGDEAEYTVIGEPVTADEAAILAKEDPYQFQWWALGLVGARPEEQKKGADKGIDGRLRFHDEQTGGKTKHIIFSVKAGKTSVAHVRDLRGVLDREKAEMGVLLTMQEPTRPMIEEAADAGIYFSPWDEKNHPRIQIMTVSSLLEGKQLSTPPLHQLSQTFKRARRQIAPDKQQNLLDG